MFTHIANIRAAKRYSEFRTDLNHFGTGIHAKRGKAKNGKWQLQAILFDTAIHTIEAAKGFVAKMGKDKVTVKAGETMPSDIDIEGVSAELEISAAAPTEEEPEPIKNFSMVAYTGGVMLTSTIPAPLIINLEGLDLRNNMKLPILMDHKTTQRVGHTANVTIENGNVLAKGPMSAATKFTREIEESSANGYPWQASLGATILKARFLDKKQSEVVNGQKVNGPVLIVDKSVLREISFVSIGADDNTSAVAASAAKNKELKMTFEQWLEANGLSIEAASEDMITSLKAMYEGSKTPEPKKPEDNKDLDTGDSVADAIKAERERCSAIRAACGDEFPEIQAKAESEGWSIEDTNTAVIKAMRENRPNINTGAGAPAAGSIDVVKAALGIRAQLDEKELVKEFGEKTVEAAYKDRGISLRDVMAAAMQSEGVNVPRTLNNDFIRAAVSTISLPGILGNVANKSMLKAYSLQNITANKLCSVGDLADFKEATRYRLNELGSFEQVGATGEIKHGTASEESATNQLKTYGKMITLSREMIINDDLSALTKLPSAMAARAAQKVDELFYTRLLSNPNFPSTNALFSAANKNYQSGGTTALDADSMDAALQLFADQVDEDGKPINVSPSILLVPTSLKFTASQLLNSAVLTTVGGGTNTTNIATANPIANEDLALVSSPWLNSQSLTGSSSTAWYLFGNPAVVDTFEIGYLRGKRTPTLEQVALPSDMLGMGWRIYFDIGVKEQDFRGMVMSAGA